MKLLGATIPVALGSAVSLVAQVLFSLVTVWLFTPESVGQFSVISQIAFFWMTLALAQSPLKLLADIDVPPIQALRAALRGSLVRLALLLPVAWAGAQFSGLKNTNQVLGWAALMAILQLAWYLAQPLTLRLGSRRSMALVRALPPVVALLMASLVGTMWPQAGAVALMFAAACGYGVGALWLLPARGAPNVVTAQEVSAELRQADSRGTALRLLHTGADALVGVALFLVWQRSYGAVQAGYLGVLLRVLGFIPTLIHTAWAQVLLSQGARRAGSPLLVGLTGALATAMLGVLVFFAVKVGWLAASWAGLIPYALPVVLWQSGACLLAACSHLPFQQGRASTFSLVAVGFDVVQLAVLCTPMLLGISLDAATHIWWVGATSAIALMGVCLWLLSKPASVEGLR